MSAASRFIPARGGEHVSPSSESSSPSGSSPHGAGNTPARRCADRPCTGSSPHGRGTPRGPVKLLQTCPVHPARAGNTPSVRAAQPGQRFIPARAGNTRNWRSTTSRNTVHPARAGNTVAARAAQESVAGSSPHGRGTHPLADCAVREDRFIPARAGNTSTTRSLQLQAPVHPRTGGEHGRVSRPGNGRCGSSPHGRGTPLSGHPGFGFGRFIPARAGNTRARAGCIPFPAVHPRTGGEHAPSKNCTIRRTVHPRTGGEHSFPSLVIGMPSGFIPARAGNTGRSGYRSPETPVHPRTGGEHVCSPAVDDELRRFIPARAGNTEHVSPQDEIHAVHPRTGGEHKRAVRTTALRSGSSPHGRGTLLVARRLPVIGRFIPARAGNTPGRPSSSRYRSVHPRTGGEHAVLGLA